VGTRVVIAPDSFKGTASSTDVAKALADGWRAVHPRDDVVELPLADGGEGTLDALAAARTDAAWSHLQVSGPDSRPATARWLHLPDGTAVAELAQSSGLPLMDHPDPLGAHTFGLGQVLAAALDAGAKRIIVGLGGSASTDGGMGCLTALGVRFLDRDGAPLALGGGSLVGLDRVDVAGVRPAPLGGVVCLTDVTSPLLGPAGAAAVFGPQKGATGADIDLLERGLTRLHTLLHGPADRPGAGAAGGIAYGLCAVWDAALEHGAAAVAGAAGVPAALAGADLLITGEGRFDATSLSGKVVGHLADLVSADGPPLAIVAGQAAAPPPPGVVAVLALTDLAGGVDQARRDPLRWLRAAGSALAHDLETRSP
jgi:glycerate kinase